MAKYTEVASYDAIGNATTPATLTAAYAANTKIMVAKNFAKLHLDINYTPLALQTDRLLYLLIELSNDGGLTFFPMANSQASTDGIYLYEDGVDGAVGLPLVIPGDSTSTGGTLYRGFYETFITGDQVRVSVKESGAGNNGTAYVRATLTSNT